MSLNQSPPSRISVETAAVAQDGSTGTAPSQCSDEDRLPAGLPLTLSPWQQAAGLELLSLVRFAAKERPHLS